MAKKVTKKRGTNKKVVKKNKKQQGDNSSSIMLLAGIGLILLIYFGSNVEVNVDLDMSTPKNAINTETIFTISGKTYSSKLEAKSKLTGIPQSQLTDEEIKFVESYKD